jgi:hypothetical protein
MLIYLHPELVRSKKIKELLRDPHLKWEALKSVQN